jgi:hypothetical protein
MRTLTKSRKIFVGAAMLAAMAFAARPTVANAKIVISNDPTKNMSCSAGVCAATRANATLNVSDLQSMLVSSNVRVTMGSVGASALDIVVTDNVSWGSGNTLWLDAYRSVEFLASVYAIGTGGVTITTNDGGSNGTWSFWPGGNIRFMDMKSGLTINGQPFKLVSDIATLANNIHRKAVGNYALADDYDATPDGVYAAAPVKTAFGGIFEGLGHTISNLQINDPKDGDTVGLFSQSKGTLRDIKLLRANVAASGIVGILVGYATTGAITNVSVAGWLSAGKNAIAGGVAGNGPAMSNCSAAVNVTAQSGNIGGLAGSVGNVDNCHATGRVTVTGAGTFSSVGGLAGSADTVTNSWTSDMVTANDANEQVGGLVGGTTAGLIENSYATGDVSANAPKGARAGGLVGINQGSAISQSFEIGNVHVIAHGNSGGQGATVYAGGLIGQEGGEQVCDESTAAGVCNVFALGNVYGRAAHDLGGNSTAIVGGLIGDVDSVTIEDAYSIGTPTGSTPCYTGGSIGLGHGSVTTTDVYWDTQGTTVGYGSCSDPGLTVIGMPDAQLKSELPTGFDPTVWGQDPNINNGYPYLLANPPPQ